MLEPLGVHKIFLAVSSIFSCCWYFISHLNMTCLPVRKSCNFRMCNECTVARIFFSAFYSNLCLVTGYFFISFLRILLFVHCIQFIVWFGTFYAVEDMRCVNSTICSNTYSNLDELCCHFVYAISMIAIQALLLNKKWLKNDNAYL